MSPTEIVRTAFRYLAVFLIACLVLPSLSNSCPLVAQDLDESRYEIPEGATPDQLLRLILAITDYRPQTFAEYRLHLERAPAAIEEASKGILESGPATDSVLYRDAKLALVRAHTIQVPFKDDPFHRALVDELTAMVTEFSASNETYSLCKLALRAIRQAGNLEVAVDANQTLGAMFEEATDPRLILNGQRMTGTARRLSMLGQKFELEGVTLDGQPFDWESFRGNWTVVYFWSTSIGPAESEIEKLAVLEGNYRNRGLQVVAVSLDLKQQVVDEFLNKRGVVWPCLFEEFAGWDHPMAIRYGVDELPHVVVVDEEGMVVSSGDTIEVLERRLGDHFGTSGN